MTVRTQQELEDTWKAILQGKYGTDPMIIAPRKVLAEPGTDIMSIPNAHGTDLSVYERKSGGEWEEIPYLGQTWPKVKAALESPKFKWRTLSGLVVETGLDAATVTANLSQNATTVVRSTIPSTDGKELFTTREHYLQMSTVFERLQNAITNKVQK